MLQNRDGHTRCSYYASEHNALFLHRRFSAGDMLPPFSRDNGMLIYLASGSMEVVMGGFAPEIITGRHLMFLPQNIPFCGHADRDLDICTCAVPLQIPLCSRYDLMDLQQDIRKTDKDRLPPMTFLKYLSDNTLKHFSQTSCQISETGSAACISTNSSGRNYSFCCAHTARKKNCTPVLPDHRTQQRFPQLHIQTL